MRALKALVIVMGVVIVAGIAVVGVTVFNRLSKPSTPIPTVATAPIAPPASNPAAPASPPGNTPPPGAPPLAAPLGTPIPQQFDRKFGDVALALPKGARVADFSASGDRLVLRVVMANQEQSLFVVDLLSGTVLGTIKLTAGSAIAADTPINSGIGLLAPLPQVNVPPRNKNEGLK